MTARSLIEVLHEETTAACAPVVASRGTPVGRDGSANALDLLQRGF